MKMSVVAALLLCVYGSTVAAAEDRAADSEALAEQVRATEIAFAKTLADRDVKAFRSMIAADVIWLADKPLRGPDQVVSNWQKFFETPQPPFSWAPELVEVQDGGKLALSTGPVFNPAGKRVGTYTSIWRREPSGEWKIIFDRGCPACDCEAQKQAKQ
jgi:ketosteroid isomerase-like protein